MVLITGASGFLGSIVKQKFDIHSETVITLGRNTSSDIVVDLANEIPDLTGLTDLKRVIHVAGKAHDFSNTSKIEQDHLNVNFRGTVHLCQALERMAILPEQLVFISSVAVYGTESGNLIDENHPLNGSTSYAKSKLKAEKYLAEWGEKNNVKILILRLPLVIGKNPPGNLKRMIRAIKFGYYIRFGDGKAQKSMVLAEDVAHLILNASLSFGIYNLTDRNHPTIKELEEVIMKHYKVVYILSFPLILVRLFAKIGDKFAFIPLNSKVLHKLTHSLTFNDQKAVIEWNWSPKRVLDSHF